jgi:hypothetical protein
VVEEVYDQATTAITSFCTVYAHSNLTFTVSGPGTFVLTASVVLYLFHTAGYATGYDVYIGNASSGCAAGSFFVEGTLQSSQPTGNYEPDLCLTESFSVGAAGTYTFEITGSAVMTQTTDSTDFWYASEVGVFYPS